MNNAHSCTVEHRKNNNNEQHLSMNCIQCGVPCTKSTSLLSFYFICLPLSYKYRHISFSIRSLVFPRSKTRRIAKAVSKLSEVFKFFCMRTNKNRALLKQSMNFIRDRTDLRKLSIAINLNSCCTYDNHANSLIWNVIWWDKSLRKSHFQSKIETID